MKQKQILTLGIDLGSTFTGFAIADQNGIILEQMELRLRDGIPEALKKRASLRRSRRQRKTRYRPARWENRRKASTFLSNKRLAKMIKTAQKTGLLELDELTELKRIRNLRKDKQKEVKCKYDVQRLSRKLGLSNEIQPRKGDGWISPTAKSKVNAIIKHVKYFQGKYILDRVVIEIANFDIQKIQNPDITKEQYQRGELYQIANEKSYLLSKQEYKCPVCKKSFLDNPEKIVTHHIKPRSQGGANNIANLVVLHETCHKEFHKTFTMEDIRNKKDVISKNKKLKIFKGAASTGIIKTTILKELDLLGIPVVKTFGYITKVDRRFLNLEKTHINDAIAIACKDKELLLVAMQSKPIYIRQVRKKKRSLHEETFRKGDHKKRPKNTKQIITKNGKKWCKWDYVSIPKINQYGYINVLTSASACIVTKDFETIGSNIPNKYKIKWKTSTGNESIAIPLSELKLLKRNNNFIQ